MTEDIVERVARAMQTRWLVDSRTLGPSPSEGVFHAVAKAALAAIRDTHAIVPREPTEAMVEAGEGFDSEMGCSGNPTRIYTAMIAAAEEEG